MPTFKFTITRNITESAVVEVTADSIEEAQSLSLTDDFINTPGNANFSVDEGNFSDPYLPDAETFEIIPDAPTPR